MGDCQSTTPASLTCAWVARRYGFNPGSTQMIHGLANVAARATVTTTLGAAAGGVSGLFIKRHLPEWAGGTGVYDIAHTCNSLLAGLVSVTAGCSVIYPWAAIVIGFFAALAYHFASCLMRRLRIDDPLDAFAVHGTNGLLGTIMVGVFAVKEYHTAIGVVKPDAGIFMPGTTGELLAAQVVSAIIVIIWVVCCSLILFGTLKWLGIYRVPAEYEVAGLDVSKHGGSAYLSEAYVALQISQKV